MSARATPSRLVGIAEAAAWLTIAGILLRIVPFRRLFRELPREAGGPVVDPVVLGGVHRIRADVGAIGGRLPWPPSCMTQALAGHLMCRARGLRIPIALSVSGSSAGFGAHATLSPGSDEECAAHTPTGRTHLARIEFAWL